MPQRQSIDNLIAEHVFGWTKNVFTHTHSLWPEEEIYQMMFDSGYTHVCEGQEVLVPHFSENISDAWLVYEKLASFGIVRISNGDGDSNDVDFFPVNRLTDWIDGKDWNRLNVAHVSADTYPMAICLAALTAYGVISEAEYGDIDRN